jgi:hypothetical protein
MTSTTPAAAQHRDPADDAPAPLLSIRDAALGYQGRLLWAGLDLDPDFSRIR